MSNSGKYLNQENIMKKVFDGDTDSLKVNVTESAPTTVVIDAADDSIAIGDRVTGDLMTVNPNGSTNTNIVGVTPISGRLPVDLGATVVNITGPVTIPGEVEIGNDSGNPIPVAASSLPLPTGASTLVEQEVQTTFLNNISDATRGTIVQNGPGSGSALADILVAGVYKQTPPTLIDGDQSEIILNSKGQLQVELTNQITSDLTLDQDTIDQIKPLDVQPAVLPTVTQVDGTAVGPGVSDEFIKIGGWDIEQAEYRQAMFRNEALIVNDSRLPANLGTQPPAQSLSTAQASGFQITRVLAAPAVNTNLMTGVVSSSDWYDAIDYNHIAFSIQNTIGSGVVQFEMSDDPAQVTGMPCPLVQDSTVAPAFITQFGLTAVLTGFSLKLRHRYFRIRISTTTAGTVTLNAILKQVAITDSVTVTNGSITVAGSLTTVSTVTTVGSVTAANIAIPIFTGDVASNAITTTTISGTFTAQSGSAMQLKYNVTAVSGTNPTLDVVIQESDDAGTTWYDVWHMPRITATGVYRTPMLFMTGSRYRYVQTIGGSSPSFTRSSSRCNASASVPNILSQFINRTMDLTALNSATDQYRVINSKNLQMVINVATYSNPVSVQLEGSDDWGITWFPLSPTPLAITAAGTTIQSVSNVHAGLARGRVTANGAGTLLGYAVIKGL